MPLTDNLTLTSELDAVNAMLAAAGESPIEDVSAEDLPTNVEMAVQILRDNTREVLAEGWRFNTLLALELPSYDSIDWTDADGNTTTLNVFLPPEAVTLLDIRAASVEKMAGVDLVVTAPLLFGNGEVPVVLFDRTANRDGFPADRFPVLYVDAVRLLSWAQMPEEARKYVAVRSARQYAQKVVGSQELSSFTERDELQALRKLKRAHGEQESFSIFQNTDVAFANGRVRVPGQVIYRKPTRGAWS